MIPTFTGGFTAWNLLKEVYFGAEEEPFYTGRGGVTKGKISWESILLFMVKLVAGLYMHHKSRLRKTNLGTHIWIRNRHLNHLKNWHQNMAE